MRRRTFLKKAMWVPPLFAIGRARGQALTLADSAFVGSLNQAAEAASAIPAGSLVSEDFEGTGAPSGWVSSGTVDWDESTVVLDGSQSLELDGTSGTAYAYKNITASDNVTGFCDIRMDTGPGLTKEIFFFQVTASARCTVSINGSKKLVVTASGGTAATAAAALTADTNYRLWISYSKGTGSNAVATVTYGTSDVKSSAIETISSTNGTGTDQVNRLWLYAASGIGIMYFDRVRVDAA